MRGPGSPARPVASGDEHDSAPTTHARLAGFVFASAMLGAWLHAEDLAPLEIAAVVGAMLAGVVGVRIAVYGGRQGARRRKTWSAVFLACTGPPLLAAWMIGGPEATWRAAAGLSLAVPVLYAFAKTGCHNAGCCGWGLRFRAFHRYASLQRLEAVASCLLALAVVVLLSAGRNPNTVLSCALIGHGVQRVFSIYSREEGLVHAAAAPDAGFSILVGLWMLGLDAA